MWIRYLFLADIDCTSNEDLAKDDVTDLKTKQKLQNEFNSKRLRELRCAWTQAYPCLVKRAISALIHFATTYFCELFYLLFLALSFQNKKSK